MANSIGVILLGFFMLDMGKVWHSMSRITVELNALIGELAGVNQETISNMSYKLGLSFAATWIIVALLFVFLPWLSLRKFNKEI